MHTHFVYTARDAKQHAFTLIELLTVIAIIGILAAIIIPVVGKVRSSARSAQTISNVRQLALAANIWAENNRGVYPSDFAVHNASNAKNTWWIDHKDGIWPLLVVGRSWNDQPTRAQREGTVFASPNLESDVNIASFNNRRPISYGMNRYISIQANRRYASLYDLSRTILFADASASNEVGPAPLGSPFGGYLGAENWINARNGASGEGARDGRAAVAYIDGHAAMIDAEKARLLSTVRPTAAEPTELAWPR
jgi:prepilin-type N-terminal cleavage/methylation domain-containing protein